MKRTKTKLVSSIVTLLICFAMLIGSTFAWFTDSASTGVNKIQAGNLDLVVEHKNASVSGYETIENETNLFKGAEGTVMKWEPGAMSWETFKVSNKGSLAFKYVLQTNITGFNTVTGTNKSLKDVLKVKVLTGSNIPAPTRESVAAMAWSDADPTLDSFVKGDGKLYPAETTGQNSSEEFQVIVYWMPTANDNDWNVNNGKSTTDNEPLFIDFGIKVLATQLEHEYDSFGNTYDTNATYPVVVFNKQQTNDVITNATDRNVNISIASGQTITLDNGIANEGNNSRDITFSGNGSQTVDVITNTASAEGGQLNYQRGSTFTFENLTIQAGEGSFDGIVCDELTFKDCTIKGKLALYGKATFIDCVFENTMDDQYSIWTWGGTDVKFEGCTFNTNGKAILLYGRGPTNLVVNNCIFKDRNNGAAGKAAIEIGNDYHATYTLTVNSATVNGFADGKNTGSKLWANKNSMDAAHLTVTIDGTQVH